VLGTEEGGPSLSHSLKANMQRALFILSWFWQDKQRVVVSLQLDQQPATAFQSMRTIAAADPDCSFTLPKILPPCWRHLPNTMWAIVFQQAFRYHCVPRPLSSVVPARASRICTRIDRLRYVGRSEQVERLVACLRTSLRPIQRCLPCSSKVRFAPRNHRELRVVRAAANS